MTAPAPDPVPPAPPVPSPPPTPGQPTEQQNVDLVVAIRRALKAKIRLPKYLRDTATAWLQGWQ